LRVIHFSASSYQIFSFKKIKKAIQFELDYPGKTCYWSDFKEFDMEYKEND